jgi:hypothetical protein
MQVVIIINTIYTKMYLRQHNLLTVVNLLLINQLR